MSIGRDLLLAIIDAAESDPTLAERVRRVLGVKPAEPTKEKAVLYVRAAEYARRVALSERTVWTLIAQGLPTIGSGRARRVDVARADEWLRGPRKGEVDAALEAQARRAARLALGKSVARG